MTQRRKLLPLIRPFIAILPSNVKPHRMGQHVRTCYGCV